MRYILFALVLGVTGCAEWTPRPIQAGDVMVLCTGSGAATFCQPYTHPDPVGPSSQEHRYDEVRH